MADTRTTLPDIFRVLRSPDLSEPEKVLWGLYRSYDSGDGAWPGDESLQVHMSAGGEKPKSIRAIQGYRASLIRKGYLTRKLNGPNPAVYRAIVPCETGAESCTSLPARGADSRTSTEVDPQNPAPLGVKDSAPLGKGVQLGVKPGVQNPAPTPTPPIEEEYGEYGKTAGEAESLDSSGSAGEGGGSSDPIGELCEEFPEVADALNGMRHPQSPTATRTTLNSRFLYRDLGRALNPDPSVRDLEFDVRRRIVGAALVEMHDQGKDWNARILSGFVNGVKRSDLLTKLSATAAGPGPHGDQAALPSMAELQAVMKRQSEEEIARLTQEGAAATLEAAAAEAFFAGQPAEIQEEIKAEQKAQLARLGFHRGKDAPGYLAGPALVTAVRVWRDRSGSSGGRTVVSA